jgi:hypothetical protein
MPEARALSADIAVCSHNDSFGQFKEVDPGGSGWIYASNARRLLGSC